jgi:bacillithiol system protein YtxJ
MIEPLTDEAGLRAALAAEVVLIYKHSPRCGTSTTARLEVERFADAHPTVPVLQVDVVAHRPLSQTIARRLGVRHESPQVLVVRNGVVAWSGSHRNVRAAHLARELIATLAD